MIEILEESDSLTEMSRSSAIDSIIAYMNRVLANVNHPVHNIEIRKSSRGDCAVVYFNDTKASYNIYPKYNGKVPISKNRKYISIENNYPNALYNPTDHSFYDNGLIGKAFVSVPNKNSEDYSGDIKDAYFTSEDGVKNFRDLLKKIGKDADPSNRIP